MSTTLPPVSLPAGAPAGPLPASVARAVPLTVSAPALAYKVLPGGYAALEDAVTLRVAPVRYPGGQVLAAEDVLAGHALLTRVAGPGVGVEIWDPDRGAWRAVGAVDLAQVKGLPLVPAKTGPPGWEGLLIGKGPQDAAGGPVFVPAVGHFPRYRLRAAFRARRDAVEAFGIGPEGPALEFASLADVLPFGVGLDPEATTATRVRIELKDAARRPVGRLEIDASANAAVVLATFDGAGAPVALVTLQRDGLIRLTPGGGTPRVLIDGDLEVGRVSYQPSAAGSPRDTL